MKKLDELRDILSNREEGYGASGKTLSDIAILWSAYLSMRMEMEVQVGADVVSEMMVLLKVARSTGKLTPSSMDDRMDIAGYSLLSAQLIADETENKEDGAKMVSQFGFGV